MLKESRQKPKPRRQHSTHKRQDETNDVQIEIEKGRKRTKKKKKLTSTTQERRQHARGIRIVQARKEPGGGCSPETKQQNNRIRHQGKQGSDV